MQAWSKWWTMSWSDCAGRERTRAVTSHTSAQVMHRAAHTRSSSRSSSARSAFAQVVHVCTHLRQASIAAATAAVRSGTPVGTASRISWVSVMLDPRLECSAVGRCRAVWRRRGSITRVIASASRQAVSKRLGGDIRSADSGRRRSSPARSRCSTDRAMARREPSLREQRVRLTQPSAAERIALLIRS